MVIIFDSLSDLSLNVYENIISVCDQEKVYIFDLYGKLKDLKKDNVTIIDLSDEITENDENLLSDRLHLSEKGNRILSEMVQEALVNP